ncbi:hypothetical protein [Luteipulveratus halotolerans]|nr:hypothetical protein [Luteipulveratus halotolerans]
MTTSLLIDSSERIGRGSGTGQTFVATWLPLVHPRSNDGDPAPQPS